MHALDRFLGDPAKAFVKKHQKTVSTINALEAKMSALADSDFQTKTTELKALIKERLTARVNDPLAMLEIRDRIKEKDEINEVLNTVLPEAFALVREASKRAVGQRHFDVQLLGGIALHTGSVAEMRTGEGKTLVATLPLYLNALLERGSHLVTVNDYLAKLAVQNYGPVYTFLGLSCGVITNDGSARWQDGELVPCQRREAYACDITYGTNNEFGFDYLRDNMAPTLEQMVQRELYYAIVDEVDSILIDEARTPLIISGPAEESASLYQRFSQIVPRLKVEEDYTVDEKDRAVSLTRDGIQKIEQMLGVENVYAGESAQLVYHLEEALKAHVLFKRDKEYVVQNGEVIIVDEFTGRMMPGRRYSEGLHQAIEAKEGVVVQRESDTLATISFQNLFRLYIKLGGMTGTAATEAEELLKIYGLEVRIIPTNREMIRKDMPDRIYTTESGKFQAVVASVKELHATGQPVLIGTISIEKSEALSRELKKAGITHEVLNAKNHEREANIIADAGRKGSVTLSTNMAGRGTDIMLGGVRPRRDEFENDAQFEAALNTWQADHDAVIELEGLHVVGTERHESRRIDNQLRGRAGRQGDPGSSQFYVSTEDDLMRIFGGDRMKGLLQTMGVAEGEAIEHKMISRAIESAQKRVEGHNFDSRKRVVQFDDVMTRHRDVVYKRRRKVLIEAANNLETGEVAELVDNAIRTEVRHLVGIHASGYHAEWNLEQLVRDVSTMLGLNIRDSEELHKELLGFQSDSGVEERLTQLCHLVYDHQRQRFGEHFPAVLRTLYLHTIDMLWVDHLTIMNELRTGIFLQQYAQQDPLAAYTAEGFRLFQNLLRAIELQLMRSVFRVEPVIEEPKVG
jgi:preprotein translocase subunit SecA